MLDPSCLIKRTLSATECLNEIMPRKLQHRVQQRNSPSPTSQAKLGDSRDRTTESSVRITDQTESTTTESAVKESGGSMRKKGSKISYAAVATNKANSKPKSTSTIKYYKTT
ncbi:hypothetical protein NPIL_259601 [Nephila pilipes]|uniref:Uncharacterized protein n=1 Tax=Nephila pilipes TaxID=299642 RepID=A0A8X6QK47_NEPPI|nr:hypothetical protein NPIL_259601 [Nephila pilipes]